MASAQRPHSPPSCRALRCCSWNILAESLMRDNIHLYKRCHPVALQQRLPRTIDGLLQLNADIIALQEVEQESFDQAILTLSQHGYEGMFKKRTGDQMDGVALLWRPSRLSLVHIEAVEYARVLTASVQDRVMAERMRKHNVGLIGVFSDRDCGREVVVATTHILWNPRRGLVKLRQMEHLFARLDTLRRAALQPVSRMQEGPGGLLQLDGISHRMRAVLALGDFNCAPSSPLHKFLLGWPLEAPVDTERFWDGQEAVKQRMKTREPPKQVEYQLASGSSADLTPCVEAAAQEAVKLGKGLVRCLNPLGCEMVSAYGHIGEPECTSFHSGFHGTVDYVLLSKSSFVVQTVLPTPSFRELLGRRSLPDFTTPSDHLPIAADLIWR